jgi:hypothetical protein
MSGSYPGLVDATRPSTSTPTGLPPPARSVRMGRAMAEVTLLDQLKMKSAAVRLPGASPMNQTAVLLLAAVTMVVLMPP